MRAPFQSLRLVLGASLLAAGAVAAPSGALAQQARPAPPPVLAIVPTRPEDRIEYTRPPDLVPPPLVQVRPAPPPRPPVITDPAWVRPPYPEYPEQAVAAGIDAGRVTLSCIVQPTGSLTDCVVRDETPPGAGFAESALMAATRARVAPRTVDGAAEPARVSFRVRYVAPPEPEPPAPAPAAPRR